MLFQVNTILGQILWASPCTQFELSICHTNWHYTVALILDNKIVITSFSLVTVKHGINHNATMKIFAWAMKQVCY